MGDGANVEDLTMAPLAPSEMDQRMISAMSSHSLIELPFFSSMPDTSGDRRFSDTRKSAFVRQVHDHESRVGGRSPPPVQTFTVKPSPDFCFRDTRGKPKVLMGLDTPTPMPFRPGRGAQPPSKSTGIGSVGPGMGCSEIFPRFDFNVSSTALTSAAYGHGLDRRSKPERKPLRAPAASVEDLVAANERNMQETEARFHELQAEIVKNEKNRMARRRTSNQIQARHESNSRAMANAMQIFGD